MNHAWIALLVPMFLSPRTDGDKAHCSQGCGAKSSCQKQEAREEAEDSDEAGDEVEEADEVDEAELAAMEAEEQVEQADEEVHQARLDQEDRDDDHDADEEHDADDEHSADGYPRVLRLSDLDESTGADVRAAVERALEQAKASMKKSSFRNKDAEKQVAEALKAAKVSGKEVEKALRESRQAYARAMSGQHDSCNASRAPLMANLQSLNGLGGLAKLYAIGSNDHRALEERVAALEARLGVAHDDPNASLEERVAELERKSGAVSVRVAPRSRMHGAPRAFVVQPPVPPTAPHAEMAPTPPSPPQEDMPELWMRSATPRAPAAATVPATPSPSVPRSHPAKEDQRREIQERMQKMREEMERLREEMTRLRSELGSGSGGTR